MTLSKPSVWGAWSRMRRGKAGQILSVPLAGVLDVQTSCSFRPRGDPKTMLRHRLHTCTSNCHAFIPLFANRSSSAQNLTQKSNIASRTSLGSVSIDISWPISRRVSQQSFRDAARRPYVDIGRLTSRQSSDVHDPLPSTRPQNKSLFGSMMGRKEWCWLGCWSMVAGFISRVNAASIFPLHTAESS
jgi:hypothetical protein